MNVVAFLQNAWSPMYYKQGYWPRQRWLKALEASRSGQRLRVLRAASPSVDWWYDNTTTAVGENASSVIKADHWHMSMVLHKQNPDVVVCLGTHAALALMGIRTQLPVLRLPHPASRVLTNVLYEHAGRILEIPWRGVITLKQGRGEIVVTLATEPRTGVHSYTIPAMPVDILPD